MTNNSEVHILLVDDDQIDVRAVTRALKRSKIANPITVARDGLEALALLRGSDGRVRLPRPYLILLDLKMPRMDGLEFLRTIRDDKELRSSIVFVLTTSDDDKDKASAYDECVAGYLLKSEVGEGFMRLVQLLDPFVLVVKFPPKGEVASE